MLKSPICLFDLCQNMLSWLKNSENSSIIGALKIDMDDMSRPAEAASVPHEQTDHPGASIKIQDVSLMLRMDCSCFPAVLFKDLCIISDRQPPPENVLEQTRKARRQPCLEQKLPVVAAHRC